MYFLLISVIYLIFISLGLPDSLLGSGWPSIQATFGVPSSYAGYVSMTISLMTIISALMSPTLIRRIHTKWIVIISIFLTVIGLLGFSFSTSYWMLLLFAIPYGLGAGAIDASINNYVANNYSGSVMNFLHCFYGVGAVISPNIMALALSKARWNEGYRWTAYIQTGILLVCLISLPLWKRNEDGMVETEKLPAAIGFVIIGTGMGPVYPAIQHMAPYNFGKRYSASVISLQMASAYVGSTFMPMVFGNLQQLTGIGIMPYYLMIFATINILMLERTYRVLNIENT